MKPVKFGKIALGASCTLALCLGATAGWGTRVYGDLVVGQVTAAPAGGEIEVSHRSYHIKGNSAADKALRNFSAGQTVDLVLDGSASSATSQVIGITAHVGS